MDLNNTSYERQKIGTVSDSEVSAVLSQMSTVAAEHGEIIAVDFDEESFAPAHMKFEGHPDGERIVLHIEEKSYLIMKDDLHKQLLGLLDA